MNGAVACWTVAAVFVGQPGLARTASAQTTPSINARTWAPSIDPRAGLVLEPSSSSSSGAWLFSAGTFLRYEHDPVSIVQPETGAVVARPLENLLGVDVVACLGLGPRAQVGLRVPMVVDEGGTGSVSTTEVSSGRVPTGAFGDLSVVGKGTLLANDRGGLGLAALSEVSFPTGAKTSFLGDRGVTATVRALADVSVLFASLQGSIGYTLRTEHVEWPRALGITYGDSIPWTLGLVVRPALLQAIDPNGVQTWEVALHGSLPAGPVAPFGLGDPGSAALSPVLLALSDRIAFGHFKDGFVLAGVDVGLDKAVGVPAVRAVVSVGGLFQGHDRDRDGVADDQDQCPTLPEDHDGFEDEDGCPEVDNDDDGVVDREDACPNVPGVPSPDPRKNGCPAEPPVVVRPSAPSLPSPLSAPPP